LYLNITSDMVVYPRQILRHLQQELPFMATEKILMACVALGKSRQEMHEVVKVHSVAAGLAVKNEGVENDLLARLGADERIPFTLAELTAMVGDGSEFVGRAPEQTEEYLSEIVDHRLAHYKELLGAMDSVLSV
nr:adenylosuccinate lyase [Deltaproteobacteria bacterium]